MEGAADDNSGASSEEDTNGELDEGENGKEEFDDPDGVVPADLDGNHSPVDGFEGYDWKEVEDDLAEFLGSDDDDDDSESDGVASASSQNGNSPRKRKRERSASQGDNAEDPRENGDSPNPEDLSGSRLAKRQQLAKARTTGLKAVTTLADNGSSLPSPDTTGEEVEGPEGRGDADDADDFDLEAELEAEIEKEFSEDMD